MLVDVGTAKAASKYEVRGQLYFDDERSLTFFAFSGVDEEVKTIPDIEKKLEQMEENGDELDLDDDDEEEDIPDIGGIFRQSSLGKINASFTLI